MKTVNSNNTDVTNTEDVWPKIEADLQFAVDNLPATWGAEVGRANTWAAKATIGKSIYVSKEVLCCLSIAAGYYC